MKKPSLILGKKQIILSCLTLMLAIAVYVNYALSDHDLTTAEKTPSEGVTYGDTAFVNAEAEGEKKTDAPEESDAAAATETAAEAESVVLPDPATADNAADYFAQARLERTASRDETVTTLQSILGGGDQTEDELVTDAIAAVETSKLIESESTIESLIKSMGYQDYRLSGRRRRTGRGAERRAGCSASSCHQGRDFGRGFRRHRKYSNF